MTYIRFARIVFFSVTLRFAVGPIPVSVMIEGFGEAGLYWDLNLINSPDHGGPMLNGIVMPTAVVGLTGELAIDIFIAKVCILISDIYFLQKTDVVLLYRLVLVVLLNCCVSHCLVLLA